MKLKKIAGILVLSLFYVILSGCSNNDDNAPSCSETNISMKINGELQTFQGLGYGISLRPNGYELSLQTYSYDTDPYTTQFSIVLPYKKKGHNIIQEFNFYRYDNQGNYVDVDFTEQVFESNVTVNRATCFKAMFSGTVTVDGQEINITEGSMSFLYDEPFDE